MGSEHPPLSNEDRIAVFRLATRSLMRRYGHRFADGMTDTELEAALADALGIFGSSGGPDSLSVTFTGAGLRIWGDWRIVNHVTEQPLFAGGSTLAMAREVYGIANPDDTQLDLL